MSRKTFVIRLKPGMKEEYKKRHDNIWPELSALATRRGIHNYTIWYFDDLLFAYYELDEAAAAEPATEEEQQLDARWSEYMRDIIEIIKDPETGETLNLECLYLHE